MVPAKKQTCKSMESKRRPTLRAHIQASDKDAKNTGEKIASSTTVLEN